MGRTSESIDANKTARIDLANRTLILEGTGLPPLQLPASITMADLMELNRRARACVDLPFVKSAQAAG